MRFHVRRPNTLLHNGWRDTEFLVLDVETTGLNLRNDEVLSYGFVVIRGGRVQASTAVEGFVRPTRSPSPAAVSVHGLRRADLSEAPDGEEAVRVLSAAVRSRVVVAHASWVEKAFLTRLFSRYQCRFDAPLVDTAALARGVSWVQRRVGQEPDLEALCSQRGLPIHTPHQALGDALTTAGLFLALVGTIEREADAPGDFRQVTAGELVTLSRRHRLH